MTQEGGPTGPAQDDYWEQEVTMTRAQLQGERDAWYQNGYENGGHNATEVAMMRVATVLWQWYGDETPHVVGPGYSEDVLHLTRLAESLR